MESSIAYVFAIVFIVLAINIMFVVRRMRGGTNKRKRMSRAAIDEAKQALWRDKEIERRLRREQEDAIACIELRNETLALYEEVRRRHAKDDELERLGISVSKIDEEPAFKAEPPVKEAEPERVSMISFTDEESEHVGWGSHFLSDDD